MKFFLMRILAMPLLAKLGLFVFRNRPLVVLYHGVTHRKEQKGIENYRGKHISADTFDRHIAWLSSHFTVVSLREVESMYQRGVCTKNICAITFDDGYENNVTTALPILKKYNVPATIFVATDFIDTHAYLWTDQLEYMIGRTNARSISISWGVATDVYSIVSREEKCVADNTIRQKLKEVDALTRGRILAHISKETGVTLDDEVAHDTDFTPLSWDQMRMMQKEGITIGAHTKTHPILAHQRLDEQCNEITHSIDRVTTELGSCKHFAYPNGQRTDWNDDTLSIFKEIGMSYAWSTFPGRVSLRSLPYALPRITLDETPYGMNRFVALVSNIIPVIKSLIP